MADFAATFLALKGVLRESTSRLTVKTDTATDYFLAGRAASPFPQHKGHPLDFAYVRMGKSYVSFHLLPLSEGAGSVSPALKKKMQGKTCFSFTTPPDKTLLAELEALADQVLRRWC